MTLKPKKPREWWAIVWDELPDRWPRLFRKFEEAEYHRQRINKLLGFSLGPCKIIKVRKVK